MKILSKDELVGTAAALVPSATLAALRVRTDLRAGDRKSRRPPDLSSPPSPRPEVRLYGLTFAAIAACAPASTEVEPARPTPGPIVGTLSDAGSEAGIPVGAAEGGAIEVFHGVSVSDSFRWLEGHGADVDAWVSSRNREARGLLDSLPNRAAILAELESTQVAPRWVTLPRGRGNVYLYQRAASHEERGSIFRFDRTAGRETRLLDLEDTKSTDGLVASWWSASQDGRYLVFRLSPNGNDTVDARVYDTHSRQWLPETISDIRYSYPAWDPSSKGFFYTWSPRYPALSAADRAAQSSVRFHTVGTPQREDLQTRPAPAEASVIEMPGVSPDGRWLIVVRWYNSEHTAIFLQDRLSRGRDWIQITPEQPFQYNANCGKGALFVLTNEGGPRRRLFRVDYAHPERDHWSEISRERADATLESVDTIGDYLVLQYLKDAESVFEIHRYDGSLVTTLGAAGLGTLSEVTGSTRTDEGVALFGGYTEPYTAVRLDAPTFKFRDFPFAKRASASAAYVTEKVFYTSPDGTRAPIFIVHRASPPARKPAPLLLYGYGTQGFSITPQYNRGLESWLDRGGVYAEAVVRGGGEYGNAWHEAGMRRARGNTYADFIAASEYLVQNGWTTSRQLVIRGASGGGLLVAVAATQRPDLYAGVVAEVPLTDMIRFPHSGIGSLLVDEFGSPDDPGDFPTLLHYSPYHSVRDGVRYPPFLILSNAGDDRVDPMHARKLAAALMAHDANAHVLLRTQENAAHGGPTSETMWAEAEADIYAFALAATRAPSIASPATP